MKISVIIPTCNAERWISHQLEMLSAQTLQAEIVIIDSGSTDATCSLVRAHAGRVRLLEIPRGSFDHGGTRDEALRRSEGEFICFLTHDACPSDERYLENLLGPFSDEKVGAVFGRQIAYEDAPEYERLIRQFNYPRQPRIWREEDISRLGVKAYFFSDACSAYRRRAYESVGGFDSPIASNEDMMLAAKLLHAGWSLAYQPEATVRHSHRYTLAEDYRRSVWAGNVMEQYRDRIYGANSSLEGLRMVRCVSRELTREKKSGQIPGFLVHTGVRFMGFQTGRFLRKMQRKRK